MRRTAGRGHCLLAGGEEREQGDEGKSASQFSGPAPTTGINDLGVKWSVILNYADFNMMNGRHVPVVQCRGGVGGLNMRREGQQDGKEGRKSIKERWSVGVWGCGSAAL